MLFLWHYQGFADNITISRFLKIKFIKKSPLHSKKLTSICALDHKFRFSICRVIVLWHWSPHHKAVMSFHRILHCLRNIFPCGFSYFVATIGCIIVGEYLSVTLNAMYMYLLLTRSFLTSKPPPPWQITFFEVESVSWHKDLRIPILFSDFWQPYDVVVNTT